MLGASVPAVSGVEAGGIIAWNGVNGLDSAPCTGDYAGMTHWVFTTGGGDVTSADLTVGGVDEGAMAENSDNGTASFSMYVAGGAPASASVSYVGTVGNGAHLTISCLGTPAPTPPAPPTTTCAPVGALGSVSFMDVPTGWKLIIEPGDILVTSGFDSIPFAVGTYTYQWRDADNNDINATNGSGKFTIAACTPPPPVLVANGCWSQDGLFGPAWTVTLSGNESNYDFEFAQTTAGPWIFATGHEGLNDIHPLASNWGTTMVVRWFAFPDVLSGTVTNDANCTPPPPTGSISFVKVIAGTDKGPAVLTDFKLTLVGPSVLTSGTFKSGDTKSGLPFSTYTVGENLTSGPANYTLDSVSCVPNVSTDSLVAVTTNKPILNSDHPNWICTVTNEYNPPQTAPVTLYKFICPSYTDVPANKNPLSTDQTGPGETGGYGGDLNTSYQTSLVNVGTDVPTDCTPAPGWQFTLTNGPTGAIIATPTTGPDGSVVVQLPIDLLKATGNASSGVVVEEVPQGGYGFGALRCYTDINQSDNQEGIWGWNGDGSIACIAYNVPNAQPPTPPTPTVATSCGGTVTFSNALAGWTLIVDGELAGTFDSSGSIGPLPEGPTSHSYSIMNGEATVQSGSFTVGACYVPPVVPQQYYGSLAVTKTLAGDLKGFAGGDFTFSVSCNSTSYAQPLVYGPLTINLASGTASASAPAITGIPLGAVCTVTETKRADAGSNATWVETTLPSGTATIATTASPASVTITNTRASSAVEGATGKPGGGVAGATGKPHITPPPTSGLGSVPAQPAGATWWIVLLGLAALSASLLVFIPKTSSERRHR
jgi:hypothetical protein